MPAEHLRAAAVVGECRQGFDRLIFALAGAEVALEPPEGGDNRARYADFLLFARKQRVMFLHLRRAIRQAAVAEHLVRHLDKILRKEALATIDIDYALIEHEIRRCRRKRGLGNTLGQRLLLEIGEPRFEAVGIATVRLA